MWYRALGWNIYCSTTGMDLICDLLERIPTKFWMYWSICFVQADPSGHTTDDYEGSISGYCTYMSDFKLLFIEIRALLLYWLRLLVMKWPPMRTLQLIYQSAQRVYVLVWTVQLVQMKLTFMKGILALWFVSQRQKKQLTWWKFGIQMFQLDKPLQIKGYRFRSMIRRLSREIPQCKGH